jgi:dihydropteroate synthase
LKGTARFGRLSVGPGNPVRVLAVINVSPESFYKGSVALTAKDILKRAESAIEDGADAIDVGAMSTAPYLSTVVSEDEEKERVGMALAALKGAGMVISVDTLRSAVADFALRRGATVVNDVSGLKNDRKMAAVVKEHGATLLAMAHSPHESSTSPIVQVRDALRGTLRLAEKAGIDGRRVVVDPGIGFFRQEGAGPAYSPQKDMPWFEWDVSVLSQLHRLESLGRPVCVGVSRKSFIGKILGVEAEDRLSGSLAATAISVANGADMIRTHDVKESVQAVRLAEAIVRRNPRAARAS